MKTVFFFVIITMLFFLTACENDSSEESDSLFSLENLPTTNFTISTNRDTILVGQKGLQLHLPADIFLDENGHIYKGTVQLELLEALTLKDIILADLETLSSDGKILESSGMFRITLKNKKKLSINSKAAVKIVLPYQEKEGSTLFYFTSNKEGQFGWTASYVLDGDSSSYWLAKGKQLLFNECASCHNTNLVSDLTGPALAWVSKRWNSMDELILYTKNNFQFADEGNLRAQYIIDWSESAMTPFEHLTDQEIKAIYDYIDDQCLFLGIDSTIFGKTVADSVYRAHVNNRDSIQTQQSSFVSNSFSLSGDWLNIDRYLLSQDATVVDFSVKILDENYIGKTHLKLIFKERNIVLNAFYNVQKGHYTFIKGTTQIGLPLGEKAYLLAISSQDSKPHFSMTSIETGKQAVETLTLKETTIREMRKAIDLEF